MMKCLEKENTNISDRTEISRPTQSQMDLEQINESNELLTATELESVLQNRTDDNLTDTEKVELRELLTQKGNNLIALHSLRKEFESKLKAVHISLTLITLMIVILLISIIFVIYLNLEIR